MSVLVRVRAQFAKSEIRMPSTTSTARTVRARANRTGGAVSTASAEPTGADMAAA